MLYRSSALMAAILWSALPAVAAPTAWRPVLPDESAGLTGAPVLTEFAAETTGSDMLSALRPFDLPAGLEPVGTAYPLVPLPPAVWSTAACGVLFAAHRVGRAVRRRF